MLFRTLREDAFNDHMRILHLVRPSYPQHFIEIVFYIVGNANGYDVPPIIAVYPERFLARVSSVFLRTADLPPICAGYTIDNRLAGHVSELVQVVAGRHGWAPGRYVEVEGRWRVVSSVP